MVSDIVPSILKITVERGGNDKTTIVKRILEHMSCHHGAVTVQSTSLHKHDMELVLSLGKNNAHDIFIKSNGCIILPDMSLACMSCYKINPKRVKRDAIFSIDRRISVDKIQSILMNLTHDPTFCNSVYGFYMFPKKNMTMLKFKFDSVNVVEQAQQYLRTLKKTMNHSKWHAPALQTEPNSVVEIPVTSSPGSAPPEGQVNTNTNWNSGLVLSSSGNSTEIHTKEMDDDINDLLKLCIYGSMDAHDIYTGHVCEDYVVLG